jgi:hypothetical protein
MNGVDAILLVSDCMSFVNGLDYRRPCLCLCNESDGEGDANAGDHYDGFLKSASKALRASLGLRTTLLEF